MSRGVEAAHQRDVEKMSTGNKSTEPQNWYGYSLVFEHVVNTEEMECDLGKEARVHLSPFNASWMRVFQLQQEAQEDQEIV